MAKSPDAFRTISEVADWLGLQAHVLRFWESKFTQVKPVKRAGGRRYYRPADMLLLGGIKRLLHDDGLTIKGVQKVLREEGINHVAGLSQPLDELTMSQYEEGAAPVPANSAPPETAGPTPEPIPEVSDAVPGTDGPAPDDMPQAPQVPQPAATAVQSDPTEETDAADAEPEGTPPPSVLPEPAEPPGVAPSGTESSPASNEPIDQAEAEPENARQEEEQPLLPAFLHRPLAPERDRPASDNPPPPPARADGTQQPAASAPPDAVQPAAAESSTQMTPSQEPVSKTAPPPRPKPRKIDLPEMTAEADIEASSSTLSAAFRLRDIAPEQARALAPLLDRLTALRDAMAAQRGGGDRVAKD